MQPFMELSWSPATQHCANKRETTGGLFNSAIAFRPTSVIGIPTIGCCPARVSFGVAKTKPAITRSPSISIGKPYVIMSAAAARCAPVGSKENPPKNSA
jgi:hypothetical protein